MSSPAAAVSKTHNLPPVVAPSDQELLDDLKGRFPELERELADFQAALKTFPAEIELKDTETAAALQDLLGKVKKHRSVIAAHKKTEKGPWSKLVSVVTNFFETADQKLEAITAEWAPRHQAYMDKVKAENLRKQEEEAERQRKLQEESRRRAEEAEQRRLAAEEEERKAKAREEAARLAAETAEREKAEAEERRAAAQAEEKRLADERKARERAERDRNEESLKAIRRHMKDATRLHDKMGDAAEGEVDQADVDQLDALVKTGGIIGVLAGPVFGSGLLSHEQVLEIEQTRTALGNMRQVLSERMDAKARRKRAAEEKKQREADEAAAEQRRLLREEDERRAAAARAAREKAEAEAAAAEASRKAAQGTVRDARAEQRGAQQEQKAAGKVERSASTDADRAANRAERIEGYLDKATDAEIAGTLRGELGTRGSLVRRWTLKIVDEDALREVCGPLGPTLTEDALNGAAYRWMLARISGWGGKERIDGREIGLPGVTFAYQQGSRIG